MNRKFAFPVKARRCMAWYEHNAPTFATLQIVIKHSALVLNAIGLPFLCCDCPCGGICACLPTNPCKAVKIDLPWGLALTRLTVPGPCFNLVICHLRLTQDFTGDFSQDFDGLPGMELLMWVDTHALTKYPLHVYCTEFFSSLPPPPPLCMGVPLLVIWQSTSLSRRSVVP